jgi:Protein of unknown function (DUF1570)
MERAVNVPGGCGEAPRIRLDPRERPSNAWTDAVVVGCAALVLVATAASALAQNPAPKLPGRAPADTASTGPAKPLTPPAAPTRLKNDTQPPRSPAAVPIANPIDNVETTSAPRFKVRDKFNQCVVARLYGQYRDKTALILPDGQLGTLNVLVPTDEPFAPLDSDQLASLLHEKNGPYFAYSLLKTEHYLLFFKSTRAFAEDSARLLEDLYRGLIDTFRRNNVPVHESEFPLVAVIFATETDFRAHKKVDPQVRAYYEYFTNRIFFFQKSERDALEPKVAALLKPQTVAHEGAHQILSNIGVQPRLNAWPPWLVEGLAEYCATTAITKKGIMWSGVAAINSLHMATIRELEDPLYNTRKVARKVSFSPSEGLLLKTSLSPTDYALAWALTHYLAQRRGTEFVKYLNAMRQIPPLEPRTPAENLAEFRKFFSEPPARLDKRLSEYIQRVAQKRPYDPLYYYTVVFVQPLGNGMIRRAARCSQSPQIIQEWVHEMTSPTGDYPSWQAYPWPTRAAAEKAAEDWMRGE